MWWVVLVGAWSSVVVVVAAGSAPEASSTLLRMHRRYVGAPPHETSLYDTLGVRANATVGEITRAYRRRSRELHPDKRRHRDPTDDDDDAATDNELETLREAYEVLKEDATRLPYHRFGLLGSTHDAAVLLTGGVGGTAGDDPHRTLLLRWMGYYASSERPTREQRVRFLACQLVETLRPLVENTLSQDQLAREVVRQCNQLKTLPLGAQILRCIGRAYRHAGQACLKQHHGRHKQKTLIKLDLDLRDKVRSAKDLLDAAVASGKLVLLEKTQEKQRHHHHHHHHHMHRVDDDNLPPLLEGYDDDDDLGLLHSDSELPMPPTDDDVREQEVDKARTAILNSLQVEALWKISKIELDRTIQEACRRMLSGDYFFYPDGRQHHHHHHHPRDLRRREENFDGWVGSSGHLIEADVGRLRAAAALVLMGDILVRCSKQGTSWVD